MPDTPWLMRSLVLMLVLLCGDLFVRTTCGQMIVAHRGASDEAPENTLAAFALAWKRGADAIEGDFYLTRDGQIVAIHDDNTKRTAGVELQVSESTLAELRKLDVGTWKSPTYRGERIPTMGEVLASVPAGKKIFIEIKCGPEIVPALRQVLEASRLRPEQTVVISFEEPVIVAVKKQIPQIKAQWLTGYKQDEKTKQWSPTPDSVLATLERIGADGLDTQGNQEIVSKAFVHRLRAAGYELHVWTVDDPAVARYFQELGVDSITTNLPALIRTSVSQAAGR